MSAPAANKAGWAGFGAQLERALRAGSQWRLLLWWVIATAVPAAIAALPVWSALSALLDGFPHAADWWRQGRGELFFEILGQMKVDADAIQGTGIGAALLMVAFMPLLNGMFLAAARSPAPLRLGELLASGCRSYLQMLRLLVVSLLPLGVGVGLLALAMKGVQRYAEQAVLESDVDHLRWALLALAALVFAWLDASVDAARASLALFPRRRSALKAWWRGLKLLVRHPLRGLGLYLGASVAALVLVAALAWLRLLLPTASAGGFLAGVALTQLAVAATAWLHYARQFAMFELTKAEQMPVGP